VVVGLVAFRVLWVLAIVKVGVVGGVLVVSFRPAGKLAALLAVEFRFFASSGTDSETFGVNGVGGGSTVAPSIAYR